MTVTVEEIRAAAALLAGELVRTPCVVSPALSELTGASVVLKLENLQQTGSFKPRGALVKMNSLDAAQKKAGVVAASAGNHAQGVAFHGRRMNIPAIIVMPTATPFNKVSRTEALGAQIVLHGDTLSECREHAVRLADDKGCEFISPYDDEKVVTGQGTIGLEMLEDHPDIDILVVPIGGGGLIAGIATVAKALRPGIEVVGVQAALFPSMYRALRGEASAGGGTTVADGIAVKSPGIITKPIIEDLVSDVLLVDEPALEQAVQTYLEVQRIVVEGAGSASLAALVENRQRFAGQKVGLVVSGGNIDSRLLSFILMRGLVREGRLVSLRIEITDTPGALAKVTGLVGESGGNIVEVYHQRLSQDIPVKMTEVDVVVETRDMGHVRALLDILNRKGFPARLLSSTALDAAG